MLAAGNVLGQSRLMRALRWASVLVVVLAACSSHRARGHVLVALTVDWEGAELDPGEVAALATLRRAAPGAPLTHFVCPAYFTKARPDPSALRTVAAELHDGDELAVHLHAWASLATASGVTPKPSPSFLTGTDKLLATGDDTGYDTDLDAYTVPELRAMLRTSRRLLAPVGFPVSATFRAGGYLATPKVREALVEEGFAIDASAIDAAALHAAKGDPLAARVAQLWPDVKGVAQPFTVRAAGGVLREVPIAAVLDSAQVDDLVRAFSAASAQLARAPGQNVLLVLEVDLETAADVVDRFGAALARLPPDQRAAIRYVTIDRAAALAE
jgi:hypothetical protein